MATITSITSAPSLRLLEDLEGAIRAFKAAPKGSPEFYDAADRLTDVMMLAGRPAKSKSALKTKARAARFLYAEQLSAGGIYEFLGTLLNDLDPREAAP